MSESIIIQGLHLTLYKNTKEIQWHRNKKGGRKQEQKRSLEKIKTWKHDGINLGKRLKLGKFSADFERCPEIGEKYETEGNASLPLRRWTLLPIPKGLGMILFSVVYELHLLCSWLLRISH